METQKIDILLLAECSLDPTELLVALCAQNDQFYFCPGILCDKIQVFARFDASLIAPIYENHRLTARRLMIPHQQQEILLIALHYQSKYTWSDANQAAHASELKAQIEKAEALVGHDRTVVVGDFNMNPFEYGMVQTSGLHAVMDRSLAREGERVVDESSHRFFYNPMWSFFGEGGKGPVHGSHFYRKAEPICYFWNIFDQVLVRPSILDMLVEDSVEIISTTNNYSFMKANGKIDKSISDHLPISFELKLDAIV